MTASTNDLLAIVRVFGAIIGTSFSDSQLNGQIRAFFTKVVAQIPQQQQQKVTISSLLWMVVKLLLHLFITSSCKLSAAMLGGACRVPVASLGWVGKLR